jgi:GTP cyclohydrolase I
MPNEVLVRATETLVAYLEHLYEGWEGVKQFGETPDRLVRMYGEFCWTNEKIESELAKVFRSFKNGYNEMLVKRDIEVWTLCPHHLLPCEFKVTIGYIPDKYVLGLSKFSRVADILSHRPIMQEEYSTELADRLMKGLQPKGVAVYVVGIHGCITARGVRQHSEVITSTLRGCFMEQPETRQEFFAICRS